MKNPNRYGTCYKLSGKRRNPYIVRAYSGKDEYGKPIYQTIGYFKTKSEGLKALMEYNVKPYDILKSKLTLEDVFNLFKNYQSKYIKKRTFQTNYQQPFEFLKSLKDVEFAKLKPLNYQQIIDNLSIKYKKSYLLKIKTMLSKLYSFAILNDIIKIDYSKGIKIIGKESKEQDCFSDIEVFKMIKNKNIENMDMILMLCLLGFRPTEVLNLKKDNIDIKNNFIINAGIKTNAGKYKCVPIPNIIKSQIYKRYNNTNNYIFPNKTGNAISYSYFLNKIYKPILETLNIKYKSPKAGRHFFATISKIEKVDNKARETMIGHTDSNFTDERYTHTNFEFLKTEYEKIERHFV